MNQIILASHGGLAAGMRSTLELIVGEVPHVHVLSATRDETESVLEGARRLLESFAPEDPVYILTDLLNPAGGVPASADRVRNERMSCAEHGRGRRTHQQRTAGGVYPAGTGADCRL